MLNILFDNNDKAKSDAIAVLTAMTKVSDTSDPIVNGFAKALKHLQRQRPLSPEEIRKSFRVVGWKRPEGDGKPHQTSTYHYAS